MTFVLSFPRYAFTHLGCHLRQTGLENLYTPYLCIGHMQVSTVDHVYGRCILRWYNLTSSYTLSYAAASASEKNRTKPLDNSTVRSGTNPVNHLTVARNNKSLK